MMFVEGTLLLFSFCIIRSRALWLVSRHSMPAFPPIVFIDSHRTCLEPAFTGVFAVIYAEVFSQSRICRQKLGLFRVGRLA